MVAAAVAAAAAALASYASVDKYELALPGRKFTFPKDHASHPTFMTEWWYYTGHLKLDGGGEYGYQLTFFRWRTGAPAAAGARSRWAAENLYFAHFALTDKSRGKFRYSEKVNRPGSGLAGASEDRLHVWNDEWLVERIGPYHHLKADMPGYAMNLLLEPSKPHVIHGINGVSQKGEGKGRASHYFSYTRMKTSGNLIIGGKEYEVSGESWMDHEFGSNQLLPYQVGWDWFGIQLDDGTELMLYQIRHEGGGIDPYSSGTFVLATGGWEHLRSDEFSLSATGKWLSPRSGASYPMGWRARVPKYGIELEIDPVARDQELDTQGSTRVIYWEGAIKARGKSAGKEVLGKGYAEMVGYASRPEL